MKIRTIFYSIILTICSLGISSCADYLDVSGEFNKELTMDEVFENYNYTRQWYYNIYNCIIEYSETGSEINAFKNPWSNMAGEIASQKAINSKDAMVAGYTAGNAPFNRWTDMYRNIRQAMIFIERAKPVGGGSNILTQDDIDRMKEEARFFIAYCYFSIFELYGPCPIVTEIDDAAYPTLLDTYERATVDQMVDFIDDILKDIIEGGKLLESPVTGIGTYNLNEIVRPTKVAAMALRAKLWVYAASPLFNGHYGKEVKNADGTPLFPQSEDRNKWNTALQRLEELLTFAEEKGHSLYVSAQGPNHSVYNLFQEYNQEILWSTTRNSYSDEHKMEKRTTPRDVNACYGTIGPSQESVDMFFTANGLTIHEDGTYKEDALGQVYNPVSNKNDNGVFNMYANREPRFYASVIYQGKSWHLNPGNKPNYTVDFSKDGGAGPSSSDTPMVGYMLGKFKNRTIMNEGSLPKFVRRVSILFRLADFYLYYAEALNEIDPTNPAIIEYIDKVRDRAGIPTYAKLEADGIKTIRGNKEEQAKAIRNERFVELFCEGQRYFDIRRWMICAPGQEADQTRFSGMNEYGDPTVPIGTSGSYYQRTVIERRMWRDEMYLYPIHQDIINQSPTKMVQNPGW